MENNNDLKRLIIKNNWEGYDYFVDDRLIEPEEITHVYDKMGNLYMVTNKIEHVPYSDWGHTYYNTRVVLVVSLPLGNFILREDSEVYLKI